MGESDNFLAWHGKQKAIFTDAKEQPVLCCESWRQCVCVRRCAEDAATPIPCCPQTRAVLALGQSHLHSAGSACPTAMSLCNLSICCESESRACAWRGLKARGLETESVESVAGGQQGSGQALAELRQAPGIAHARRAPCSSWGCTQGSPSSLWQGEQLGNDLWQVWNRRTLLLPQGERSRVTGALMLGCVGGRWHLLPILHWRGLRAPRCHHILLFLSSFPLHIPL